MKDTEWENWRANNEAKIDGVLAGTHGHADLADRGIHRIVGIIEPARHEPKALRLAVDRLILWEATNRRAHPEAYPIKAIDFGSAIEATLRDYVIPPPTTMTTVLKHQDLVDTMARDPQFNGWALNERTNEPCRNRVPRDEEYLRRVRYDVSVKYNKLVSANQTFEAVMKMAGEGQPFNPVKEALEELRWDGVERLGRFAFDILGSDCPLDSVYVKRWFIGAVARAMRPGCKMDTIWVLQGAQGAGKSTLFRILAGHEDLFHDTFLDLEHKDSMIALQGPWIVECSEIDQTLRKRDTSLIKNFLSSKEDKFRPPFAKKTAAHPRKMVFVGTTNDPELLSDATGNRRFWITRIQGKIDLQKATEQRDQLFAEAVVLYRHGHQWWLTDEEHGFNQKANIEYEVTDPSVDSARVMLYVMRDEAQQAQAVHDGLFELRLNELLTRSGLDQTRRWPGVVAMLRSFGFTRRHTSTGKVWRGPLVLK